MNKIHLLIALSTTALIYGVKPPVAPQEVLELDASMSYFYAVHNAQGPRQEQLHAAQDAQQLYKAIFDKERDLSVISQKKQTQLNKEMYKICGIINRQRSRN